ncbi:hypothetical protein TVAG_133140 [Trichomonas vaginalis G3]|uniref:RRM domain-containing protein n=1 Tax=Trichomonas vaginalis (strain ATCC PRA-98 / G3) TaxID=412133 RepID=A2EDJ1_TRIV3|nr:RNA-binding domain, RBD family-containing protein [Trichomonas vaginalis G3]EAY09256.1 hypothetical protein TVAG_133140 [Trichomonas vaginalis G3]KAI5484038.1 RNA-binding domain, RBD family-containing protein [Trichomonas vaginalis G3]|eukprot:XP_001321479.1 hypothetical protein [Trichomonas vaginalis G3]
MAEELGLSPKFLAPYVVDKQGDKYIANVPKVILEHLRSPDFTEDVNPMKQPQHAKLHLVLTNNSSKDENVTIDDLVEREFSSEKWTKKVKIHLASKGVYQANRASNEDDIEYSPFGRSDDKFTVKLDGLPEPFDKNDVMDLLYDCGCNYFDKVNIPRERDSDKLKPVAFIKFDRLRHAILFIENNPQIKIGQFILAPMLVP